MTATRPRLKPAQLDRLYQRNNVRPLLYTLMVFAGIGLTLAAAIYTAWSWPAVFVIIAALQHHLLIVQHEALHNLLLTNRGANDFLGRVVGYPIGFALAFRRQHLAHLASFS